MCVKFLYNWGNWDGSIHLKCILNLQVFFIHKFMGTNTVIGFLPPKILSFLVVVGSQYLLEIAFSYVKTFKTDYILKLFKMLIC